MPKLWEALLTLAILIAALAVGIIIFGVDPVSYTHLTLPTIRLV